MAQPRNRRGGPCWRHCSCVCRAPTRGHATATRPVTRPPSATVCYRLLPAATVCYRLLPAAGWSRLSSYFGVSEIKKLAFQEGAIPQVLKVLESHPDAHALQESGQRAMQVLMQ